MTCRNCYKEKYCPESDRECPCREFVKKVRHYDSRKAEKVQRMEVGTGGHQFKN